MTTPAGPGITGDDVLAELRTVNPGRSSVLNLGDSDVLALAGVPGPFCSFSQLCGKTAASGGGGAISVAAPNVSARKSGTATGIVSGSSTASASGGSGTGFSFSWTFLSGDPVTASGVGSSTCSFSKSVSRASYFLAYWRVTATDSLGATGFTDISVELMGVEA